MSLAVAVVGLALVSLPGMLRPLGRRLAPSGWARLSAAALLSGIALFELAALLVATPMMLRAFGLLSVGRACERLLTGFAPGGLPTGVVAGGIAALVPVAAWHGASTVWHTTRRARQVLRMGDHRELPCGASLVVLPNIPPVAVSVPGRPPRVVVGRGLVEALDAGQFRAVCDHEAAHLRLGHSRYLLLAMAAERVFCFWPPAKPSVTALRVSLERWADESAASGEPVHRKAMRSALLAVALAPGTAALAALSGTVGLVERLDALEHLPARMSAAGRATLLAPGLVLALAAALSLALWSLQAHCAFGMC